MKLTVTGRHVAVTEATRTDITQKIGRLRPRPQRQRGLRHSASSAANAQPFVCELTVHVRGDHMLHARGPRCPALGGRLAGRREGRPAGAARSPTGGRRASAPNGVEPAPRHRARGRTGVTPRVVRSRDYAIKPMSVEDAVLELSAGGRPFLVFRQAASERIAVLFRRPDGHFGLIEPEA